ncbi:C-type lectin domain-containing protein [Podarcis lilfordi]|uniref:C-type lectin domain-containing protein n=1 Tax=Podarcis lilfordi TaxID=74358 RepID=A0AA35PIG2_9SAUR|nr:C-type lectin domain-containing protein [Podarcis lilfordi]
MVQGWVNILQNLVLGLRHSRPAAQEGTSREEKQKMGQVVYLGLCLLGCLILNPLAEGAANRTQSARTPCPAGAVFYRKYCYEYSSSSRSWDDAEVSCQRRHGSQLASILSAREANVVYSYLRQYGSSNVWIGLAADRGSHHVNMIWEWSDGSVFSQPLWDGRSISNSISSYECVSISYSGSQKWIQRSCTTTLPYLCKYKATY